MKSLLFIDRDGTILREPADEQIDSFEKFSFVPGAISALRFLRQHTDFLFVMVSNQDGLGTDSYPEETFWPTHNLSRARASPSTQSISTAASQKTTCRHASPAQPC